MDWTPLELYREFLDGTGELAPRLLDIEHTGANSSYLNIEYVRRSRAWPWRELGPTSAVLSTLADLHTRAPSDGTLAALASWDYEAELRQSALWTAGIYDQAVIAAADVFDIRRYGPALDRLVLNLPQLRAELLNATPAGAVVVHGDVHSGAAPPLSCRAGLADGTPPRRLKRLLARARLQQSCWCIGLPIGRCHGQDAPFAS